MLSFHSPGRDNSKVPMRADSHRFLSPKAKKTMLGRGRNPEALLRESSHRL